MFQTASSGVEPSALSPMSCFFASTKTDRTCVLGQEIEINNRQLPGLRLGKLGEHRKSRLGCQISSLAQNMLSEGLARHLGKDACLQTDENRCLELSGQC